MLAKFNGRCTLCSRYVRAGKSRIDTLGFAMPVDPRHTQYDPHFDRAGKGRWIVHGEVFHHQPPASTWLHEDCVAAFLKRHGIDSDDHRVITDERTQALREIKRREEAMRDPNYGRRKP